MRHFITCTLCEATCGLDVVTEGGSVTSIRGDADDPFSRGHVCPKAVALKDIHEDPDRLRRPVRREAADWRESGGRGPGRGGPAAVDVQRAHGRDAVAVYLGNPNVHSLGSMLSAPAFARALRTQNRFSATSVDQLPHQLVAHLMFGHQLLLPIPDVDRTNYLLVFGANPVVSNGSLMTAPDIAGRLEGDPRARRPRRRGRPAPDGNRGTRRRAPFRAAGQRRFRAARDPAHDLRRGPGIALAAAPHGSEASTRCGEIAAGFPPERVGWRHRRWRPTSSADSRASSPRRIVRCATGGSGCRRNGSDRWPAGSSTCSTS